VSECTICYYETLTAPCAACGREPSKSELLTDARNRIERLERAFTMLFAALDDPYWPGRIIIEGPMRDLVRDIRKELGWPND